jgi:sarcosine oxidase subunit alpha
MPDAVQVFVNGNPVTVSEGSSVASAVLSAGEFAFRRSVSGEPRGPFCGMGICLECGLTIDGVPHARSCQTVCRDGMVVTTA